MRSPRLRGPFVLGLTARRRDLQAHDVAVALPLGVTVEDARGDHELHATVRQDLLVDVRGQLGERADQAVHCRADRPTIRWLVRATERDGEAAVGQRLSRAEAE